MTKLLLVDDENNSRLAIEEYLGARGFEVVSATDGEAAVALGLEAAPDVLVCDWLLPGEVGGREVARVLLDAFPALTVLIITGLPVAQVEQEAGDLPLAGVLAKPVSLAAIERAVRDTGAGRT